MRNCLSKIWNRQFLIFLFFLFLSTCFWIFQAMNEPYDQEYKIKVALTNVPEGAIITTEPASEIEIKLHDRGVALFNYKFNPVVIDYNHYANPSGHVRILTKELLKQVNSQLNTSTQILSTKPDTIEFYYNHGLHKRVPIVLDGEVKTETGYIITEQKLSSDSVTVYAASSLLDDITEARIKVDYLKNISGTTKMKLNIVPRRGAKFIPNEINLNVKVDRLVEKKQRVPIRPVGFPSNLRLLPIPQETEVIFEVGMNRYSEISADDFIVIADYKQMPDNGNPRYPLRLVATPNDVSRARIVPNQVEYIIEKVNEPEPESETPKK